MCSTVMKPSIAAESFSERLCLDSMQDVPGAWCNTTCLTATDTPGSDLMLQSDADDNEMLFQLQRSTIVKVRAN